MTGAPDLIATMTPLMRQATLGALTSSLLLAVAACAMRTSAANIRSHKDPVRGACFSATIPRHTPALAHSMTERLAVSSETFWSRARRGGTGRAHLHRRGAATCNPSDNS